MISQPPGLFPSRQERGPITSNHQVLDFFKDCVSRFRRIGKERGGAVMQQFAHRRRESVGQPVTLNNFKAIGKGAGVGNGGAGSNHIQRIADDYEVPGRQAGEA
jgi:hypothetical protein